MEIIYIKKYFYKKKIQELIRPSQLLFIIYYLYIEFNITPKNYKMGYHIYGLYISYKIKNYLAWSL